MAAYYDTNNLPGDNVGKYDAMNLGCDRVFYVFSVCVKDATVPCQPSKLVITRSRASSIGFG